MANMFRADPRAAMEGLQSIIDLKQQQLRMQIEEERHLAEMALRQREQDRRDKELQANLDLQQTKMRLDAEQKREALQHKRELGLVASAQKSTTEGTPMLPAARKLIDQTFGEAAETSMLGPLSEPQEFMLRNMQEPDFSPDVMKANPEVADVLRYRKGLPPPRPHLPAELEALAYQTGLNQLQSRRGGL
ncbi:MAG: hypothetical protein KKI08_23720, partial [Armatimonadetes bacterium]|nr:hypothetical protein [Armatimonadota bacterium]